MIRTLSVAPKQNVCVLIDPRNKDTLIIDINGPKGVTVIDLGGYLVLLQTIHNGGGVY